MSQHTETLSVVLGNIEKNREAIAAQIIAST